ncbi:protein N-lysine methyltransferase family protein [Vibrio sp.]|uniref:Histidine kinase n=1 Tax=Vibrio viridaestus TaxID=2487322 RepID=A0A3N9U8I8_9VIBR|nr:histidine kinase [Vibrio viridaestus]MDC0611736.1 protein N-lysine methyltransferase family protein [Vibrio sp.]RQW64516.1 histidine kinase [Vibrio viridaestus]
MEHLRLRYQTIEFDDIDIHLCTLRNRQEYYDPENTAKNLGISSATWPIFGVVWPSSVILAQYMYHSKLGTKKILEVGCGIGLSSLLLNKLHKDITATDYHPESQHFLERNTTLNHQSPIPFERTDWSVHSDHLGLFDVIIGSDLLYEESHAELLSGFIQLHAKPNCEVIIVDPGRGNKNKFKRRMKGFGFISSELKPTSTDSISSKFKGYILKFIRNR